MVDTQTQKRQAKGFHLIYAAAVAARPIHWIKNLAVFAPLFLSGNFFDIELFTKTFWAFIVFCFVTSATYIINDIFDRKVDLMHPTKKFRPIACGLIPVSLAITEAIVLLAGGFIAASIGGLDHFFTSIILFYLVMQFLYSLFLKNVAILDIMLIAAGFVLRVYAGAIVINSHISVWFLLCVISVALFLASGKRRAELNTVGAVDTTRKSLIAYKKGLLNSYVTMFGAASWLSWSLFTFFESPRASLPVWLVLAELSKTTTVGKLLMLTIPVAIFGIMRYESLIFQDRSERPEKLILKDKSLIAAVITWILLIFWVLYSGITVI